MRPLLLTLHSFGPYGESESVDFSALSERGLFLITGNTGAGKTTIFDAIVFALYGKASGSGRETEFFRSDYAAPDSVCSVDFTFAIGEQQYSVSRRPRQTRLSLRKNGQEVKVPAAASLSLPDGTLLTNINQVDEKLQELLGLTESQFKQIVLLPQGEFRKFLEAKTRKSRSYSERSLRLIFTIALRSLFLIRKKRYSSRSPHTVRKPTLCCTAFLLLKRNRSPLQMKTPGSPSFNSGSKS